MLHNHNVIGNVYGGHSSFTNPYRLVPSIRHAEPRFGQNFLIELQK